jgi:hypothetical protein
VTALDLPEAKGTYFLIASAVQMKRPEIGRVGAYGFVPGFYAYIGSAFGSGGLRAPRSPPGINRLCGVRYASRADVIVGIPLWAQYQRIYRRRRLPSTFTQVSDPARAN